MIPGQEFSYEITVANTGSDTAEGVVITDTLPAEVSVVDVTANGVVSGNTVTWSIGTYDAEYDDECSGEGCGC